MSLEVGPILVLGGTALSLASIGVWGVNVGDGACAWRVAYSPRSRAFGIWSVIYSSTVLLALLQAFNAVTAFNLWANVFWALSWTCCAVWVPLFDASSPGSLIFAAAVILAAAALATAATWQAAAWRWIGDRDAPRSPLGLPLSLLAGWLLAASAIGVGIAIKANLPNATQTCVRVPLLSGETPREYRARRRRLYREAFENGAVQDSFVPVLLAAAVAGLSVAAADPVLPLPLAWAVRNLRMFPSVTCVSALLLCLCGASGAVVRILTN